MIFPEPTVIFPFTVKFPVVVAPPEMVSPPACVPLPIVEEAVWISPAPVMSPETVSVEVAVTAPPKKEVPLVYWLPCTEKLVVGVVVPIPMLPAPLMTNLGFVPNAEEEATSKSFPLLVSMPSVH